jgi:hypothetical protein
MTLYRHEVRTHIAAFSAPTQRFMNAMSSIHDGAAILAPHHFGALCFFKNKLGVMSSLHVGTRVLAATVCLAIRHASRKSLFRQGLVRHD